MIGLLGLVSTLLLLVELVLIARVVLDWVGVLAGPSGTAALLSGVRTALHRVTEPALAAIRRKLPNVRIGGVSLDLSVTAVLLGVIVLRSVLP